MSQQRSDKLFYNDKIYQLKSATLADLFSDEPDRSSPLASLLEINNLMQYFSSLPFHSANMRGYLCGWKIKDDKLFLTSFTSRSQMIHSTDQLIGKSPPALSAEDQEYQKRKEELEAEFEKQYGSISDLEKEMQKLRQPFDDWDKEVVPKEMKEAHKAMKQKIALLDLRAYDETDEANEIDEAIVFADWFSGSLEVKEFDDYDEKINGLRIEISKGLVVCSYPCHVYPYFARPLKNYIED
jgi:hypothetical protein